MPMDMVCLKPKRASPMRDIGIMMFRMVMVRRNWMMELCMKGNIRMVRSPARENIFGKMLAITREDGLIINCMDMLSF